MAGVEFIDEIEWEDWSGSDTEVARCPRISFVKSVVPKGVSRSTAGNQGIVSKSDDTRKFHQSLSRAFSTGSSPARTRNCSLGLEVSTR